MPQPFLPLLALPSRCPLTPHPIFSGRLVLLLLMSAPRGDALREFIAEFSPLAAPDDAVQRATRAALGSAASRGAPLVCGFGAPFPRRPRVPPQWRRAFSLVCQRSSLSGRCASREDPSSWIAVCDLAPKAVQSLPPFALSSRHSRTRSPPSWVLRLGSRGVLVAVVALQPRATFQTPPSTRTFLRLRPLFAPLLGNVLLVSLSPSRRLDQPAVAGLRRRLTTARHPRRLWPCSPMQWGLRSGHLLRPVLGTQPLCAS